MDLFTLVFFVACVLWLRRISRSVEVCASVCGSLDLASHRLPLSDASLCGGFDGPPDTGRGELE